MAEALRAVNSALRIVVMYDRSASKTEHADAVLQIDVPPADLVHSIEYLLDGNTAPGRTAS
jgi:type III secretory pathway lipoprotein EscJ